MSSNFISLKSDKTEIMFQNTADEVNEELFESLLERYQIGLETSMKGSEFIFNCVNSLYYQFYKIGLKRGGSYTWQKQKQKSNNKNKKATMNPINDDKGFQYVATVTLNHKEIGQNLHPFIGKHNRRGINYTSRKDNWAKFEKYVPKIAFVLYLKK